jgi:exodeoxyribonuclease V alpha subunit
VNIATGLSPFGTARAALMAEESLATSTAFDREDVELLDWLRPIGANLELHFNLPEQIVYLAWQLGRWQSGLDPGERRLLIVLILAALLQTQAGSTRLNLAKHLAGLIRDLVGCEQTEAIHQRDAMRTLLESGRLGQIAGASPAEFKPLLLAGEYLYIQKMHYLEERFVAAIRSRRNAHIPTWTQSETAAALSDVLARPAVRREGPVALTEEQRDAVRIAVEHPLAIISGGPGTGKTTVVLSILRVLRRLGLTCDEYALTAPTGKAANRLGDAIRTGREQIADPAAVDLDLAGLAEPRTLHRLLGYSSTTGRFLHHENNRLAERVVVVDESSMIDLSLMERLVRSLRDDSRLILLGDVHQLPSVEAGAVLRDLLEAEAQSEHGWPRAVHLTQSHRMRAEDDDGRNLVTIAREVDQGNLPEFAATRLSDRVIVERGSPAALTFHGVEFMAFSGDPAVLAEFLRQWEREAVVAAPDLDELSAHHYMFDDGAFRESDEARLRTLFDCWERFRILCLSRVLPTGSNRINAILHERLVRKCGLARDEAEFIPGDPVMMQVNDYRRMIFNGDQGLILSVTDGNGRQPMAVFRRANGFFPFHPDSLRSTLQLSYAMTVHKAQGSEFDRVAIILPDRDLPINTREILYTALTRARQSAILLGSRDVLTTTIKRSIVRDSGIIEELQKRPCG